MRRLLPVLALVALVAGCGNGSGSGGSSACHTPIRERLDPYTEQHVLPGASIPPYSTNPPTSGAHQLGKWPKGVLDTPMTKPVQVALLEGGEVLIQYRGLKASERDDVERLAHTEHQVTVAPNPDLPDRVVATAWTYKQVCSGVDVDALRRFVKAHAGKGG